MIVIFYILFMLIFHADNKVEDSHNELETQFTR